MEACHVKDLMQYLQKRAHNENSPGYHLAECRHVPLVQVPFRKNRNLILVQVELSTWPSAPTCPLIQVISQTGKCCQICAEIEKMICHKNAMGEIALNCA